MNLFRRPGYVRISLLSACNLQCSYCQPSGESRPAIAAPEDKVRTAIRFLHRSGIRKIRFTGGEPTLYKNLHRLVAFIKTVDKDIHTAITSNGVLLAPVAKALSEAGLDSANISIDTLDPEKFHALTGHRDLNRVLAGIDAAAEHITRVKLNCVLIRGFNDDEVEELISFADRLGLDIRFIEFMPNRYSPPGDSRFISSDEIRRRLPWEFSPMPGQGSSPASYYTAETLNIRVGFINSVSHPFCHDCNRIRLTAAGMLYNCLFDSRSINLFDLLDSHPEQADSAFEQLIASKRFEGRRTDSGSISTLPSFSAIGG